jgi:predicted nuclease of predicted toxin-antitoxin system
MDHHVPAAITAGLRQRGIDVMTAQEDGSDQLDDDLLLERARQLDRVLFSQDRDLLRIANEWLRAGRDFGGLVYAHQLSITIGQAIRDLELIAQSLNSEDLRNHIEFLPL